MNTRMLTIVMSCSISTMALAYQGGDTTLSKGVPERDKNVVSQFMRQPVYFSVFGGGGSFSTHTLNLKGTALFGASQGGPLAVNAYGVGSTDSIGFGGLQVL